MRNTRSSLLAATAFAALAASSASFAVADSRTPPDADAPRRPKPMPRGQRGESKRRNSSTLFTPNGERECARRRRQIASGMLKVSA